jgi:hypothetical protein
MINWLLTKLRRTSGAPVAMQTARVNVPIDLAKQVALVSASGLFDEPWYLKQNPDVANAGKAALEHYLTFGWKEERDPSPGFSTRYYLEKYGDVRALGISPLLHYCVTGQRQNRTVCDPRIQELNRVKPIIESEFDEDFYRSQLNELEEQFSSAVEHYVTVGWARALDPHPQFSTGEYLQDNQDVRVAKVNPYAHYLEAGRTEGRLPKRDPGATKEYMLERKMIAREFELKYYLSHHADVALAKIDPLHHFLVAGWRERRDPNCWFSVDHYLETHTDVRDAGINPLFHYLAEGRREGRSTEIPSRWIRSTELRRVVSEEFDSDFYLQTNPDVARADCDPLEHFLNHGWKESRNPTNWFSCDFYLQIYEDVADSGLNPFYHYLATGRAEGRQVRHPGGWKAEALVRLKPLVDQVDEAKRHYHGLDAIEDAGYGIQTEIELSGRSKSGVVVCVSQDDYTVSVGGVQLCISLEERAARAKGFTYINIHPAIPIPCLLPVADLSEQQLVVMCNGRHLGNCSAAKIVSILKQSVGGSASNELIVHSMLGHGPEFVIDLHRAIRPTRSIFWLHDYFGLCPSYTLLRNGITHCEAPAVESTSCSICVYGQERRSHTLRMKNLFEQVDFSIVSPSEVTKKLWISGTPPSNVEPIVHPHCQFEEVDTARTPRDQDSPIRVAFVGHPTAHKGWYTYTKILNRLGKNNQYEFYHFGAGRKCHRDSQFVKVSVVTGGPTAMIEALTNEAIDVVVLWSIWPETFSIVAYEVIASGADIVCSSASGNIAQLVRDTGCGIVFGSEEELLSHLDNGQFTEWVGSRRLADRKPMKLKFGEMSLSAPYTSRSFSQ